MQLSKRQVEWAKRIRSLANAMDITDPGIVDAAIAGMLFRSHLDPQFKDASGEGIAGLNPDEAQAQGIDLTGPDAAIQFVLTKLQGDPANAVQTVTQLLSSGDEAKIAQDASIIQDLIPQVSATAASSTPDAPTQFSDIVSPEHRFRRAIASGDQGGVQSVVNDLITQRVQDRSANATDRRPQQPQQPA